MKSNPFEFHQLAICGSLGFLLMACQPSKFSASRSQALTQSSVFAHGEQQSEPADSQEGRVVQVPDRGGSASGAIIQPAEGAPAETALVESTPTPLPISVPAACSGSVATNANAFADAVRNAGLPLVSGREPTHDEQARVCQAAMTGFSAATTDIEGNVRYYAAGSSPATVWANCFGSGSAPYGNSVFVGAHFEQGVSLRGVTIPENKRIVKTSLCKPSAVSCSPVSSDFIVEVTWTSDGNGVQQLLLGGGRTLSAADIACGGAASLHSPLIVEDSPGAGILTLAPVETNTYFDLTGDGRKERISCVKQGSFLVLPDSKGAVRDIHQLFGNNTIGPDGRTADNGFLALAKYDANQDGIIDDDDIVFHSLKLWRDGNCDGLAQPSELTTLEDRGIRSIQVRDYVEIHDVDPYGNVTKQRSLVEYLDGSVTRIFDLWFRTY